MTQTFVIQDLTFSYPEQERPALERICLTVEQGEFLVLCGPSGCGKSTLLRQLKTALAPHGTRTGEIRFEGTGLETLDQRAQSAKIGFVLQNPDNQLVTDKVWHELAFGLESLGFDTPAIRRRVAEMASFFGIQTWFHQPVHALSGGQKQLLNLACVMTLQPSVLILDEPTSQLDPIAAADFLAVLGRINRELGTTVILTEHRLEEAFALASRAAVLDGGRLLCTGTPGEIGAALRKAGHDMFLAMPTPMRVWAGVESGEPCPVTVREGREWLARLAGERGLETSPPEQTPDCSGAAVLEARQLWFKYGKELPDVVRGLSLQVRRGEFLALLGGNGVGKSTALKLLSGLAKPYRGQVVAHGSVAALPQDPQTLFGKNTVRKELLEMLDRADGREEQARLARVTALCRLEGLLDRHPYDLSGGEQQRAALAKVLLRDPCILLLDEPTKGLDAAFKQTFAQILQQLLRRGTAILMVSHDIEFCAQYAHRCALFFDGGIVTEDAPRAFFSGNSFYTTAANRMARPLLPQAVTVKDVICACGGTPPGEPELPEDVPELPVPKAESADWKPQPLPWWRKLGAALSGAGALALFVQSMGVSDLTALMGAGGMTAGAGRQLLIYGMCILLLFLFAACVGRRSHQAPVSPPAKKGKLTKRTLVAAGLILLLIPLTLFVGVRYLEGKKYYFIALLILLETMLPFFLVFEGKKPQAQELVVIAVLCAIAVAGRAVFYMLPQFKPVMALTILAGVAFGGETGFLMGAMTMLASNVMFSQGPWAPWQMFAMGIVGFLAGVLFRKGWLRRTRASLCVFGALAAVLIYGGIMNAASALMWAGELNWAILLSYFLSGFPFDCVQAAATGLFLWFAARPILEKLERIKVKYGLMEDSGCQKSPKCLDC